MALLNSSVCLYEYGPFCGTRCM